MSMAPPETATGRYFQEGREAALAKRRLERRIAASKAQLPHYAISLFNAKVTHLAEELMMYDRAASYAVSSAAVEPPPSDPQAPTTQYKLIRRNETGDLELASFTVLQEWPDCLNGGLQLRLRFCSVVDEDIDFLAKRGYSSSWVVADLASPLRETNHISGLGWETIQEVIARRAGIIAGDEPSLDD